MSSPNKQPAVHVYLRGWYRQVEDKWQKWDNKNNQWKDCPRLPNSMFPVGSATVPPERNFGLTVYLVGLASLIAVLLLTVFFISKDEKVIAVVLAPVTALIGAFTGHAAGHAAARH